MFDCHINTEISAHKRCFKYIYKYCFKSPDKTTVHVDEIDAYLSGRFLTAGEAVWRILGLRLHNECPAVKRLDVHLPNHHFSESKQATKVNFFHNTLNTTHSEQSSQTTNKHTMYH
jgi:hypothetical protein